MKPEEHLKRIDDAAGFLRDRYPGPVAVGIILGSGLGDFGSLLEDRLEIPYAEIPNFPVSSVIGHSGKLVFGTMAGLHLAVLSGRVHGYEGYAASEIVFPTRVLGRLGIGRLIVTNAAGGIRRDLQPGDLMLIEDHINLLGMNPLQGANIDLLGVRFPDMSEAYDPGFRTLARGAAEAMGLTLASGVYVSVLGPSYETPAEIEMFRRLGADAVGMSTVPEVIAANHMGIKVLGISCITNMAAGVLPAKLDHREVLETTTRVRDEFVGLLRGIVRALGEEANVR